MKKKIAITIDEEVLNAIKKIDHDEDRTLSSKINKIIKDNNYTTVKKGEKEVWKREFSTKINTSMRN